MIAESLKTIVGLINNYVNPGFTVEPMNLANISKFHDGDEFVDGLRDKLILSVVNIEEDRMVKSPENFVKVNQVIRYKNPALHFNLTLLIAATHEYEIALRMLEKVIRFFQRKNVFTPSDTPQLDNRIDKLIFDLMNLNLEQVHQLWTTLGGHYMPSVVFKMRMLTIDEEFFTMEAPPITQIIIDDKLKLPQ